MGFQGKGHMRTKIVMNGQIIEQVRDFNYLTNSMAYRTRRFNTAFTRTLQ